MSELLDMENDIALKIKHPHRTPITHTSHNATTTTHIIPLPQIPQRAGWDSFDLYDLLEDEARIEEEIDYQ